MHWLAIGLAWLVALGIIVIGTLYVSRPRAATLSFGLPLPEEGPNVAAWLRLKGVRDIASGAVVLAVMAWGAPRVLGVVILALALIPVGDMLTILSARGSTRLAFGMHGVTALVMVLAAVLLIMGAN